MKKLITVILCLLLLSSFKAQEEKTIFDLTLDANEASEELFSIYSLDVFNYFNLHEYDTELKKSVYQKSAEYQNYLSELKKEKSERQKLVYYIKEKGEFKDIEYNVKRKGFEINLGCNYWPCGHKIPKSIYLPNSLVCIFLRALPIKQVATFNGSSSCDEILFIPLNENDGLEIENDKTNIDTYFFFTPSGVERLSSLYIGADGNFLKLAQNYLKSDKVRVVVANRISGKIYFDKAYSYRPPQPKK